MPVAYDFVKKRRPALRLPRLQTATPAHLRWTVGEQALMALMMDSNFASFFTSSDHVMEGDLVRGGATTPPAPEPELWGRFSSDSGPGQSGGSSESSSGPESDRGIGLDLQPPLVGPHAPYQLPMSPASLDEWWRDPRPRVILPWVHPALGDVPGLAPATLARETHGGEPGRCVDHEVRHEECLHGQFNVICDECNHYCNYCCDAPLPRTPEGGSLVPDDHSDPIGSPAPQATARWFRPHEVVGDIALPAVPRFEVFPTGLLSPALTEDRLGQVALEAELMLAGSCLTVVAEPRLTTSRPLVIAKRRGAQVLTYVRPGPKFPLQVDPGLWGDLQTLSASSRIVRSLPHLLPSYTSLTAGIEYLARLRAAVECGDSHVLILVRAMSLYLCALWAQATGGRWGPTLGDGPCEVSPVSRMPRSMVPNSPIAGIWVPSNDVKEITFWRAAGASGQQATPHLYGEATVIPPWAIDLRGTASFEVLTEAEPAAGAYDLDAISASEMARYISTYASRLHLEDQLNLARLLAILLPWAAWRERACLPDPVHTADLWARFSGALDTRELLPSFGDELANEGRAVLEACVRGPQVASALGRWLSTASGIKKELIEGREVNAWFVQSAWMNAARADQLGLWARAATTTDDWALNAWARCLPWTAPNYVADLAVAHRSLSLSWNSPCEVALGTPPDGGPGSAALAPTEVKFETGAPGALYLNAFEAARLELCGFARDGPVPWRPVLRERHWGVKQLIPADRALIVSSLKGLTVGLTVVGWRVRGDRTTRVVLNRLGHTLTQFYAGAAPKPSEARPTWDDRDVVPTSDNGAELRAPTTVRWADQHTAGVEVTAALTPEQKDRLEFRREVLQTSVASEECERLVRWYEQRDWEVVETRGDGWCGPEAVRLAALNYDAPGLPPRAEDVVAAVGTRYTPASRTPWDSASLRAAALHYKLGLVLSMPEGLRPLATGETTVAIQWRDGHFSALRERPGAGSDSHLAARVPTRESLPPAHYEAAARPGPEVSAANPASHSGTPPAWHYSLSGLAASAVRQRALAHARLHFKLTQLGTAELRARYPLYDVACWNVHSLLANYVKDRAPAAALPVTVSRMGRGLALSGPGARALGSQLKLAVATDAGSAGGDLSLTRAADYICDTKLFKRYELRPLLCACPMCCRKAGATSWFEHLRGRLPWTGDAGGAALSEAHPPAAVGSGIRARSTIRTLAGVCRGWPHAQTWQLAAILARLDGTPLQTVVSVTLWAVSWPANLRAIMLTECRGWGCAACWPAAAKAFSDLIRVTSATSDGSRVDPSDIAILAYPHALAPKAVGEVDWAAERAKRTEKIQPLAPPRGYASAEAFIEEVVLQKMRRDAPAGARPQALDSWWARRAEWAVAGAPGAAVDPAVRDAWRACSITTAAEHHPQGTGSSGAGTQPHRAGGLTKQQLIETLPADYPARVLLSRPEVNSGAHTKRNELAGKLRAIYGVDFPHYAISSYCAQFESQLMEGCGFDLAENVGEACGSWAARCDRASRGDWLLSFDYEDFNAQHTTEAMQAVYRARERWVRERVSPGPERDEVVRAMRWLTASLDHVTLRFPDGDPARVYSGLLSGYRDTTFLNTWLNYAYAQLVGAWTRDANIPTAPPTLAYYHGDDVLLGFESFTDALGWRDTARAGGLRANPDKCLLWQGHGEYLRVWVTNSRIARGHLCRAIGSWCSGNWDQPGVSAGDHVAAVAAQCGVLVRRGMPGRVAAQLALDFVAYWDPRSAGSLEMAAALLGNPEATCGVPLGPATLAAGLEAVRRVPRSQGVGASDESEEAARVFMQAVTKNVARAVARKRLPARAALAYVSEIAGILPNPYSRVRLADEAAAVARQLATERWAAPLLADAKKWSTPGSGATLAASAYGRQRDAAGPTLPIALLPTGPRRLAATGTRATICSLRARARITPTLSPETQSGEPAGDWAVQQVSRGSIAGSLDIRAASLLLERLGIGRAAAREWATRYFSARSTASLARGSGPKAAFNAHPAPTPGTALGAGTAAIPWQYLASAQLTNDWTIQLTTAATEGAVILAF